MMLYFKASQYVPGKGDAWMYYECNDDKSVRRYMTHIPGTQELDKVPNPFIKKLQRPDDLHPATEEEFFRLWPSDGTEPGASAQEVVAEELSRQGVRARKHFNPDMTVLEAMAVHDKVSEVFAAFHLGGCSNCGISEIETVGQVCMGYGVDVDILLEVLEELMVDDEAGEDKAAASEPDEAPAEVD